MLFSGLGPFVTHSNALDTDLYPRIAPKRP